MNLNTSKLPKVPVIGKSNKRGFLKHDAFADVDGDNDAMPKGDELYPLFDYNELEPETRAFVQQKTDDIRTAMGEVVKRIVEVGQGLIDVKAKLEHGRWLRWLDAEFGWSDDTARNYMNVVKRFGQIPNGSEFAPKALYLLSQKSTPEAAREEAIERARAGEPITYSTAKTIVNEHKPRPPVTPPTSYGKQEDELPSDEPVDDYVEEFEAVQADDGAMEDAQAGTDLQVGATVKTSSGYEGKLMSLNGRIAIVETANGKRPYDIANLTLANEAEDTLVQPPVIPNYKRDAKTNRAAIEYVPQGYDACLTPGYVLEPLFPYLGWSMPSTIWEPAAGENHLVDALYGGGWTQSHVIASDILTGQNFFDYEPGRWDIIVTNPPFSLKYRFLERCYELGKPFALLLPVETLGAKTAQDLMQQYGFEMMLLDSRVDFKMPNKGWDGAGSQFPVMWLCWHLLPEKVMFGSISEAKKAFKHD